ncbi:MAG: glutathionylspermidine synthase family protein [Isosphaeraceae bacterium]
MLRIATPPRADWTKVVESQGLLFHSIDGEPYWDETAYYLFEANEVDLIEAASYRLNEMCLEAVGHVIEDGRLGEFDIPAPFHEFVARSWEHDEHTIYGRFDLAFDGSGPPRLLEFNADTPTALLEAAVIQWFWFRDLLASSGFGEQDREQAPFDQFNSLHERLIEAWGRVRREMGGRVVFAAMRDALEDVMTVTYLRDTAIQAGLKTEFLAVKDIGWHARRRVFTDLRERTIEILFKLYPWEWLLREPFGRFIPTAPTRWLEPPWKMVLSNKAILPVLYELFPESPYLLRAGFEPIGESYVVKPIYSREGSNITIVQDGRTIAETGGDYTEGPHIYQEFRPLPSFDGRYPVIGSWIVNGYACGVGIREDDGLITRNTSRFLPHIFRKSSGAKPPTMNPKTRQEQAEGSRPSTGSHDPLWDPWLDR